MGQFSTVIPGQFLNEDYNLSFGTKPRLFLSKIQTEAIRRQSPVIPVSTSMTGMLRELGFNITVGKRGTMASFKEQTSRLAACRFRVIYAQSNENRKLIHHENADIFKHVELKWSTKK